MALEVAIAKFVYHPTHFCSTIGQVWIRSSEAEHPVVSRKVEVSKSFGSAIYSPVAQLVEPRPVKAKVVRSYLTGGAIFQ